MKTIKPFFLCAKTKKALEAEKVLKKKYKYYSLEKANIVVVLGGDGLILSLINHEVFRKIKIFGMNRGTVGFLLNTYSHLNLLDRIRASKETKLKSVSMEVTDIKKNTYKAFSLNEVSLLRQNRNAANIRVKINDKIKISKLVSDGILLSTPAGSTAYNLSAHGPILPLNSSLLALTAICPFRPRRWNGALIPENSSITLEIIDPLNRPVSATAGQVEIRNVSKVKVKSEDKKSLKLLFDKKDNLEEKIFNEQFNL